MVEVMVLLIIVTIEVMVAMVLPIWQTNIAKLMTMKAMKWWKQ